MAIVIEKKERKTNWFAIATAAAILGLAGSAVYFLFFSAAPFIEVVVPIQLQDISTISRIDIDPGTVLGNPIYQALRPYVADPTTGTLGRPNPFISF